MPPSKRPLFSFARVLLCLGVIALLVALSPLLRAPGRQPVQLALLTSLQGITAPCGCTSRPLGGLDLLAASIEAQRRDAPVALVSVGPTFFDPSPHSVELGGHRRATARIIADILAGLGTKLSFVTSPELKEGGANDGVPPWEAAGLPIAPMAERGLVSSRIVAVGGHKIGLLMAAGDDEAPSDVIALGEAARALKQQKCEGIIVAFVGDARDARAQLAGLTDVELVVAQSQDALSEPEPLGSGMLVDAGARGEHIGYVTLRYGKDKALRQWQWDDGGESLRRPLREQQKRFEREAAALPDGAGKQARLKRAQALAQKVNDVVTPTLAGTSLGWRREPLDVDRPRAQWASRALLGYNDGLCDIAMAETGKRTCADAKDARERYVGSAACQACHAPAWDAYQQSKHAHAWATLELAHKTCDVSCVGCHVVGWEKPGGFCHLADHKPFDNVGCENCHGPGAGHISAPTDRQAWGPLFVRDTPEATCRSCHNAEHSDQFEFARYRAQVVVPGHGLPMAPSP